MDEFKYLRSTIQSNRRAQDGEEEKEDGYLQYNIQDNKKPLNKKKSCD